MLFYRVAARNVISSGCLKAGLSDSSIKAGLKVTTGHAAGLTHTLATIKAYETDLDIISVSWYHLCIVISSLHRDVISVSWYQLCIMISLYRDVISVSWYHCYQDWQKSFHMYHLIPIKLNELISYKKYYFEASPNLAWKKWSYHFNKLPFWWSKLMAAHWAIDKDRPKWCQTLDFTVFNLYDQVKKKEFFKEHSLVNIWPNTSEVIGCTRFQCKWKLHSFNKR